MCANFSPVKPNPYFVQPPRLKDAVDIDYLRQHVD